MQHFYALDVIAELRDADPEMSPFVVVSGYSQAGDGGGGMFRWHEDSTEEPDGGLVFAGSQPRGRWKRIPEAVHDVRHFGAKGDGDDATSAIQRALNAAAGGGSVYIPSGRYLVRTSLRVPQGAHVHGDGLFSEIHYYGPPQTGCFSSDRPEISQAMGFARLNVLLQEENTWAFDLRGISFSRFDQLSIHMRKPRTSGFYGPGDGQSPYYNLFTACSISGAGDHRQNGCVGFDFWYDEGARQSANANQVVGGHINTCQWAVRCYGTGNVFCGQVLEMVDTGYEFNLAPDRLKDQSKGTGNDVFGVYTEYVDTVIRSGHKSCYVTAELTMVTGYKQVFEGDGTENQIVISPHDGVLESSRSFINRRIDTHASFDKRE